jgi:hypothetical protein
MLANVVKQKAAITYVGAQPLVNAEMVLAEIDVQ